jgi:hypothetical protein
MVVRREQDGRVPPPDRFVWLGGVHIVSRLNEPSSHCRYAVNNFRLSKSRKRSHHDSAAGDTATESLSAPTLPPVLAVREVTGEK